MSQEGEKDNVEQGITPVGTVEQRLAVLEEKVRDLEFNEDTHFPQDCYSFLSVYGPGGEKHDPVVSMFGVLAFVFQMTFLVLLFLFFFRRGDFDKMGGETLDPVVVITQFTAVLFFALMPDASLTDIITAYQIFPHFSSTNDDRWSRRLAGLLRMIQGISATFVALVLILTSDTSIDIILNFTAVNFISDIDGTLFSLAKNGVFGAKLGDAAKHISNKLLPKDTTEHKTFNYVVVMVLVFLLMVSATIWYIIAENGPAP